jgi:hypothetical protein
MFRRSGRVWLLSLALVGPGLSLGLGSTGVASGSGTTRTSVPPVFNDDFDGSSIDSSRWNTNVATSGNRWCPDPPDIAAVGTWVDISVDACYGLLVSPPYGSIAVAGGLASLSAPDGRSFGYIVAGPPSRHPFPDAGDFVLELRMRYDFANVAGDGVMALATQNADPVGTSSPTPNNAREVFRVWNDGGGLRAAVLFGKVVSIPDASAFHDYRLEYVGGAYSLFVDTALVLGPIASAVRPSTIWVGNPVALWWGSGSFGPWTAFTMDFIRVTAGTSPINTVPPTIAPSRRAVEGTRLHSSLGTWINADSFAIDWRRCGTSGCQTVGHNSTYTLKLADLGSRMRLDVTAFNAEGSATASSTLTNPVEAAPPLNVHPPTVSGSFAVGSTLTASTGSWTGTDTLGYAYQWLRCDNSSHCGQIGPATSSTYVVQQADIGHTLRVRVTAGNGAGIASAASAAFPSGSSVSPPRSTALPGISGTAAVGQSLQAGTATWTGTGPITLTYQWRRCPNLDGTNCVPIAGATGRNYLLTSADQGSRLRVSVIAHNAVLVNRVTSYASGVVSAGT